MRGHGVGGSARVRVAGHTWHGLPPSVGARLSRGVDRPSNRVPRVHDHVHQRDAQPFGVGRQQWRRPDRARQPPRADRGLRRGRRFAAERVEVGRRQLEANRAREIEHFVDDPVQPRHFFVDVGDGLAQRPASASGWRSVCSAALMIISGLRTSCAMTVDRRPSDDSRSFCDISRWNRAIESVSVLNVVASSRASSSSHRWPLRQGDLARQVAGGGDVAHHVGDGGERLRDGARHGEAEERREEDGDHGRARQLGVDGAQQPELLGARAEDQRDRGLRAARGGLVGAPAAAAAPRYSSVLSVTLPCGRERLRLQEHRECRPVLIAAASPRESGRPCRTRRRCR